MRRKVCKQTIQNRTNQLLSSEFWISTSSENFPLSQVKAMSLQWARIVFTDLGRGKDFAMKLLWRGPLCSLSAEIQQFKAILKKTEKAYRHTETSVRQFNTYLMCAEFWSSSDFLSSELPDSNPHRSTSGTWEKWEVNWLVHVHFRRLRETSHQKTSHAYLIERMPCTIGLRMPETKSEQAKYWSSMI